MLSTVTLDCQVTKIVMNSGSQLQPVSQLRNKRRRMSLENLVRSPHLPESSEKFVDIWFYSGVSENMYIGQILLCGDGDGPITIGLVGE